MSYVAPDMFRAAPAAWPFAGLEPQAYDVIMADPPWRFALRSKRGEKKSAQAHYSTMSIDELRALPVADLARGDCLLWLWATWPMLPVQMGVLKSWGFSYVTGGAWDKRMWGPGYVIRSVCEPFLLGTIGEPRIRGKAVGNIIRECRREHSRKPEDGYAKCEKLAPWARRRAELFSRTDRPGWNSWGDEIGKFNAEDDQ